MGQPHLRGRPWRGPRRHHHRHPAVPIAANGIGSDLNSGTALSIGVFTSLMIAGLASTLPATLAGGLRSQGVPAAAAQHIGSLPPVSSLFAALLGVNPIGHLLASNGLSGLPASGLRGGRYVHPETEAPRAPAVPQPKP